MEANVLPFALISLLGSLIYVAVVLALHVLPTGYDPRHNAVSDYGVGTYAPLFRVSLWAGSIAVLTLLAGLALGVGSPPRWSAGTSLFWAWWPSTASVSRCSPRTWKEST